MYFIWSLLLTVALGVFIYKYLFDSKYVYEPHPKSHIFMHNSFDSIATKSEYVMMVVGLNDCSMCKMVLDNTEVSKLGVTRYYLELRHHPNNKLVASAFGIDGFPRSFIFNKNRKLVGVVHGAKDIEIEVGNIIQSDKAGEIMCCSGELAKMNGYFAALLKYTSGDAEGMYDEIQRSSAAEEDIFSAYMKYKYHYIHNNTDSTDYFRRRTLSLVGSNLDVMTYENIVRELAPMNPALLWLDASNASNKL